MTFLLGYFLFLSMFYAVYLSFHHALTSLMIINNFGVFHHQDHSHHIPTSLCSLIIIVVLWNRKPTITYDTFYMFLLLEWKKWIKFFFGTHQKTEKQTFHPCHVVFYVCIHILNYVYTWVCAKYIDAFYWLMNVVLRWHIWATI